MINRKNVFIVVCALGICGLMLVGVGNHPSQINLILHVICLIIFFIFLVLIVPSKNARLRHKPIDIGKAIECGLSPNLIDSFKIVENHLSKHVPDTFAIFQPNMVIWAGIELSYALYYYQDGHIALLASKGSEGTDEGTGQPCRHTDFRNPVFCIPFDSERNWEFVKMMKMLIK